MEEFPADAVVEADAARHVLHVGADLLAQVRHLVDEGDLDRQEGVGGVLDQLGRAPLGEQHRRLVEEERPVELAHHFAGFLAIGADDDAVGPLEVVDRCAFAQEFGVGDNGEFAFGPGLADDVLDLIAGADRHGRFGHHDGEAVHVLGDLLGGGIDVGEVGMAVAAAGGRADGDEDGVGVADSVSRRRA